MTTATKLQQIATILKVPVTNFHEGSEQLAQFELRERVAKLTNSYVSLNDRELSDTDLLRYIADRILQDLGTVKKPTYKREKLSPKVNDTTFSLEDGKGRITYVVDDIVTIILSSEEDGETINLFRSNLEWYDQFKRWEYGDLNRK